MKRLLFVLLCGATAVSCAPIVSTAEAAEVECVSVAGPGVSAQLPTGQTYVAQCAASSRYRVCTESSGCVAQITDLELPVTPNTYDIDLTAPYRFIAFTTTCTICRLTKNR